MDGRGGDRAAGDAVPMARARCVCGAVRLAIEVPAFWAWHDHSRPTQLAHGAAYATYVGTWRSRLRITDGADDLGQFVDPQTKSSRQFCRHCGTPMIYAKSLAAKMVNIPRALFETRTGREPRYHIALEEAPEWAYRGEALGPLKGYPGVLWTGARRRKRGASDGPWAEPV